MKDLRIKEPMSREDQKQYADQRIEYVYGAVTSWADRNPILLRSCDFWMPLSRAKRIHKWLGEAIEECERVNKAKRHNRNDRSRAQEPSCDATPVLG